MRFQSARGVFKRVELRGLSLSVGPVFLLSLLSSREIPLLPLQGCVNSDNPKRKLQNTEESG